MTKKNKIILFGSLGASILIFILAFSFDVFSETTVVDNDAKGKSSQAVSKSAPADIEIVRKAVKGDPSVLKDLLAWSTAPEKIKRERAATHMWRYPKEASAFEALKKLTTDENLEVRQRAYSSLAMSIHPQAKIAAQDLLKNEKVAKQEKLLIQLFLGRGKKGQVPAAVIAEAAANFDVSANSVNSNSNRFFSMALLALPEGKAKLKAMYEASDPKKVKAPNAAILVSTVGQSCPSNRFEYFEAILNVLKKGTPRDQMQVLGELRRHGTKGAALISSNIPKDNRLPANYTKNLNDYLGKKQFKDFCAIK